MSERLGPGMVWRIKLKKPGVGIIGDSAYIADNDAHLSWWKQNLMHGIPLDEWVIEQIPDPMTPDKRADWEAYKRAELEKEKRRRQRLS